MKQKKDAHAVISDTISPTFKAPITRVSFYAYIHSMKRMRGGLHVDNSLTDIHHFRCASTLSTLLLTACGDNRNTMNRLATVCSVTCNEMVLLSYDHRAQ